MSTEASDNVKRTITFTIQISGAPLFPLATHEDGSHAPLEYAVLKDAITHSEHGPDTPSVQHAGSPRLQFPAIVLEPPVAIYAHAGLRVHTGGPAVYGRAIGRLDDDLSIEYRMVFREVSGYAFVATYLTCDINPTTKVFALKNTNVYTYEKGDDVLARATSIVADETMRFQKQVRTGARPELVFTSQFVESLDLSAAGDAVTASLGLPGKRLTVSIDEVAVSRLPLQEKIAANALIELTKPAARLPDGPRPQISAAALDATYEQTLRFAESLLAALPQKWPPFNSIQGAVCFLRERIDGSDRQIAKLERMIMTRRRRPSPHRLAWAILMDMTGLSDSRLREVISR